MPVGTEALGTSAIGAIMSGIGMGLSGNAQSKAKAAMRNIANTPGVDWRLYGREALQNMQSMFPTASQLGSQINDYYTSELNKALENAYPGYTKQRGQFSENLASYLSGQIPQNLQNELNADITRATAGKALMGGFSGSPLQANMLARNLGREYLGLGLGLQQYGMNTFSQVPNMFPRAAQYDITQVLGLTPQQLISLKSQERSQAMAYGAQAAGMPGMTGSWGSNLQQVGGAMMGMGMMGMMGGGSGSGGTGGGSYGGYNSSWPSQFGANNTWS